MNEWNRITNNQRDAAIRECAMNQPCVCGHKRGDHFNGHGTGVCLKCPHRGDVYECEAFKRAVGA